MSCGPTIINDAFDPQNFRFFDFKVRLSDWGAGIRYDLSRAFRLDFSVIHFFGFNEYTYIDETNVLYATGFQQADETSAVLMINGAVLISGKGFRLELNQWFCLPFH